MAEKKKILVHACCASCSSYVLPYLSDTYNVTAYFFNPNIHPAGEYKLRLREMRPLCRELVINLIEGDYLPEEWQLATESYRHLPERSERCWACYRLRLAKTAETAAELGIETFTSTLSVSPHKVHPRIVDIGKAAAKRLGLEFLAEDFKKKNGFKISVQRSKELGLTRQDYCGCALSLEESRERKRKSDK
ncbi:MAG: epoxyqueuosine reductase QueH [Candidatus Krumholzibacteria bacterium]|nr:epoxyqueuosine reductase QueH [Candidatus Krumholzibacteria bacterium]